MYEVWWTHYATCDWVRENGNVRKKLVRWNLSLEEALTLVKGLGFEYGAFLKRTVQL